MLSSEFQTELAALIRSLQQKVATEPDLRRSSPKDHLERAIVSLVSLYLELSEGD